MNSPFKKTFPRKLFKSRVEVKLVWLRRGENSCHCTGYLLPVMWTRSRFWPHGSFSMMQIRIRVAKNQQKSWETRIKIDRNRHNIIFLNIEITLLFNAHKQLAYTKHNKSNSHYPDNFLLLVLQFSSVFCWLPLYGISDLRIIYYKQWCTSHKSRFTRYQNSTAMFNRSTCMKSWKLYSSEGDTRQRL